MQLIKNVDKSILFIPETISDNSFLEYLSGLIECYSNGVTIPAMGCCSLPVINAIGDEQNQSPFSLHWTPPVFGGQGNLEFLVSPDLD